MLCFLISTALDFEFWLKLAFHVVYDDFSFPFSEKGYFDFCYTHTFQSCIFVSISCLSVNFKVSGLKTLASMWYEENHEGRRNRGEIYCFRILLDGENVGLVSVLYVSISPV